MTNYIRKTRHLQRVASFKSSFIIFVVDLVIRGSHIWAFTSGYVLLYIGSHVFIIQ